jgi:hypothetical protein
MTAKDDLLPDMYMEPESLDPEELSELLSGEDVLDEEVLSNDKPFTVEELFGGAPPKAVGTPSHGDMSGFSTSTQVRERASYRAGPRAPGTFRSESPSFEIAVGFENSNDAGVTNITCNHESFLRLEKAVAMGRASLDKLKEEGLEPQRFAAVLAFRLQEADRGPQGNRPPYRMYFVGVGNNGVIKSQEVGADVAKKAVPPGLTPTAQTTAEAEVPPSTTSESLFGLPATDDFDPFS